MIDRVSRVARNALRDLRYGRPLGGMVKSRYPELGVHDAANSDYNDLKLLFADVAVRPDDVIVDVGCGKGRALNWFLSRFRRHRIYGIEYDPQICERTARRLRRFRNVTILCGDAIRILPDEGTLFYLFSPFGEQMMRSFISSVLELSRDGRPRRVVYNNGVFLDLWRGHPRIEVRSIAPEARHPSALIVVTAPHVGEG
jgi:SAM-dependent methyltransferase